MLELTIPARLFRAAAGEFVRAGPESRDVRLSFSSEVPVLRELVIDGRDVPAFEVLGHGTDEIDLSLLAGGNAPLLLDHMPTVSAKIGTVISAGIEAGRGVAVVRFAASVQADEIFNRINGGENFAVSVGYQIGKFARSGEHEGRPFCALCAGSHTKSASWPFRPTRRSASEGLMLATIL